MARGGVVFRGATARAYELTAPGTAGQVLTSNGPGADPSFEDGTAGDLDDYQLVVKTATESVTSSTALQDDDELQFAIGAGEVYAFDMRVAVDGATGGDVQFAVTAPTNAMGTWQAVVSEAAAAGLSGSATIVSRVNYVDADAVTAGTSGSTDALITSLWISGVVINYGLAGTVRLRWAQAASSGTPTRVRQGSYLEARRANVTVLLAARALAASDSLRVAATEVATVSTTGDNPFPVATESLRVGVSEVSALVITEGGVVIITASDSLQVGVSD